MAVMSVPWKIYITLQHALNKLPEQYREVILLRFAEGMQFNEIASTTKAKTGGDQIPLSTCYVCSSKNTGCEK